MEKSPSNKIVNIEVNLEDERKNSPCTCDKQSINDLIFLPIYGGILVCFGVEDFTDNCMEYIIACDWLWYRRLWNAVTVLCGQLDCDDDTS